MHRLNSGFGLLQKSCSFSVDFFCGSIGLQYNSADRQNKLSNSFSCKLVRLWNTCTLKWFTDLTNNWSPFPFCRTNLAFDLAEALPFPGPGLPLWVPLFRSLALAWWELRGLETVDCYCKRAQTLRQQVMAHLSCRFPWFCCPLNRSHPFWMWSVLLSLHYMFTKLEIFTLLQSNNNFREYTGKSEEAFSGSTNSENPVLCWAFRKILTAFKYKGLLKSQLTELHSKSLTLLSKIHQSPVP